MAQHLIANTGGSSAKVGATESGAEYIWLVIGDCPLGAMMSYSATRLTCFALISALEEDLRSHIENFLVDGNIEGIFSSDEEEKARRRRYRDRNSGESSSQAAILPYLDFADAFQVLRRNGRCLPDDLRDKLASIQGKIEKSVAVRNRVAHTRPMEIDDLPALLDLCGSLTGEAGPNSWPKLDLVLNRLKRDPSYVLGLSINLPSEADHAPMHNLPVPDFDETGFYGRRKEVQRIKKIVKGAYPVVSILGDGGIGKTAIALKVAYELLDDPGANFDAVVWVTAKAQRLTTSEIKRINGAIEDSLGLFDRAAEVLGGGTGADDSEREVLEYLEHFKVLLILDNLETVLDARLRDFLLDIPVGSKVIVTSRIGLGVENPVKLPPLTDDEATGLLYALSRIRDVKALQGLPRDSAEQLSRGMKGSPAYIKWFVSGVQSGKRPEDLLVNNELLLDYCMSNVYEYLSGRSLVPLRCLQVLPGQRTHAEIAFLTDSTADDTQAALLELLTTNFVQMRTHSGEREIETNYELSEFGRSYLDKRNPVSQSERINFQGRNKRLLDLGNSLRAENTASPFDPVTVSISNPGDYSAARLLREAINSAQRGQFEKAIEGCSEARRLAPTFFEGWRVEAFVHTRFSDFSSARNAYERACELADDYAPLNFFFGSFLIDENLDVAYGLARLRVAARKEPDNPEILSQIAWANLMLGNYEEVLDVVNHVVGLKATKAQISAAITLALRAGIYQLRGLIGEDRAVEAAEFLESVVIFCDSISVEFLAGEPCDRMLQAKKIAEELREVLVEEFHLRKLSEFRSRLLDRVRCVDPVLLTRGIGTVKSIRYEKLFAFVRLGETDYFFHLRDLVSEPDWDHLSVGGKVAFEEDDSDHRGPRAMNVRWID